ncbi:hypothetical protein BXY66_1594 [Shimia isoporae]|uniref:Uncharacterized protein n=1 Tax=Shimia isoporae TaxID=647720 RepID=A0A4R1NS06_9RHOB|nr:hypothetical protein [Shimia isoporae]TCL09543.1 hypothetical protein BXY66_1594 [Shimia isoporae]
MDQMKPDQQSDTTQQGPVPDQPSQMGCEGAESAKIAAMVPMSDQRTRYIEEVARRTRKVVAATKRSEDTIELVKQLYAIAPRTSGGGGMPEDN